MRISELALGEIECPGAGQIGLGFLPRCRPAGKSKENSKNEVKRFLPSFTAHELMDVSDKAVALRDSDRYTGFRRNLSTALKTEWVGFLRE
jgi:hypothetical protein